MDVVLSWSNVIDNIMASILTWDLSILSITIVSDHMHKQRS
jgi:hypothetical protein